jgi:hypothetical protein
MALDPVGKIPKKLLKNGTSRTTVLDDESNKKSVSENIKAERRSVESANKETIDNYCKSETNLPYHFGMVSTWNY